MNLLKKLFSPSPFTQTPFHKFEVKCNRCGEVIQGQVNVYNDPSLEVTEDGRAFYLCRKVLMGSGHCFQQIEVLFKFNEERETLGREITGGEFVDAE